MNKNEKRISYLRKKLAKLVNIEQDERELAFALDNYDKLRLNMQNVMLYGAYLQGLREGYMHFGKDAIEVMRGDKKVYAKAEYDYCMKSLRNLVNYHQQRYEGRYRNHKRDKKGKLVSCEYYIVRSDTLEIEI